MEYKPFFQVFMKLSTFSQLEVCLCAGMFSFVLISNFPQLARAWIHLKDLVSLSPRYENPVQTQSTSERCGQLIFNETETIK